VVGAGSWRKQCARITRTYGTGKLVVPSWYLAFKNAIFCRENARFLGSPRVVCEGDMSMCAAPCGGQKLHMMCFDNQPTCCGGSGPPTAVVRRVQLIQAKNTVPLTRLPRDHGCPGTADSHHKRIDTNLESKAHGRLRPKDGPVVPQNCGPPRLPDADSEHSNKHMKVDETRLY
jgi:hypothetical protein